MSLCFRTIVIFSMLLASSKFNPSTPFSERKITGYCPIYSSHNSLFAAIYNYIKEHKGKCEVYSAPFAVFINKDDFNYVEPDISVVCDPNKLNDKGCNGAPDWIIEIVSPSSRRMDCSTKLFKYRTAGVREYWIVDPAKERITVWDFENDDTADYTFKR